VRAVVDPNVLVSALISSGGPPRQIVAAWVDERFELIASPTLLDELRDVLARTKFRRWVSAEVAADFVEGLKDAATLIDDPPPQPGTSPDPDDDYLIALARTAAADCLVSGIHPEDTDTLLAKPHSRPFEMRGREMQGWLRVDPEGLRTKRQLAPWVTRRRRLRPLASREAVGPSAGRQCLLVFRACVSGTPAQASAFTRKRKSASLMGHRRRR
jgi:putative PIN family toxin of toxin-antitoxin system